MFETLKDDAKFIMRSGRMKVVAGTIAVSALLTGTGVVQARPEPFHPPGMDFGPVGRYKVDASPYGLDGVLYRSHPDVHKSVKGLYPANGTIIYGKEPVQYPNWILADNGYWLPLEVDGKPCISRVSRDS